MSEPPSQRPHQGAVCKTWVHDESFSREDVLFNASAFPQIDLSERPLLKLDVIYKTSATRENQPLGISKVSSSEVPEGSAAEHSAAGTRHGLVFLAKDCDAETKAKHPNLQVSVSSKIAKLYGLKNYTEVSVQIADKAANAATHVEICFRDVYLTRADLHRMVSGVLLHQSLFEGQNVVFLGSIRVTIKALYVRGRRIRSGLFESHTKPIFRSESARYVLYIQMSREMWDFDTEGSGEIVFNKVIKVILPELFRRWTELNARHVVSVVLFTRLELNPEALSHPAEYRGVDDGNNYDTAKFSGRDFYRVVVGDMSSGDWETILYELKKEFKSFLKDVLTAASDGEASGFDHEMASDQPSIRHGGIVGRPSPAMEGNILEALNLASSRFSCDWLDPDLFRSGLSIIVISPGPGFFEVDEDMLHLTTENLVKNGVGIDLICLSERPLHEVPVFGFRKKSSGVPDSGLGIPAAVPAGESRIFSSFEKYPVDDLEIPSLVNLQNDLDVEASQWTFVVPQWVQVHFVSGSAEDSLGTHKSVSRLSRGARRPRESVFVPKCRMYEVQMTGIMENEMSNIMVPNLHVEKFNLRKTTLRDASATLVNSSRNESFQDSLPNPKYLTDTLLKPGNMRNNQQQDLNAQRDFDESGWMDEYDKIVFVSPKKTRSMSVSTITSRPMNNSARHRKQLLGHIDRDPSTSSLSGSPVYSSPIQANFPREPMLYNSKALEDNHKNEPSLRRQDSKESVLYQHRIRASSSLLPFGGQLKAGGKAIASTQYNTETATSISMQAQREKSNSSSKDNTTPARSVSQQVKSSLSRHASGPVSDTASNILRSNSSRAIPMDVPQVTGLKIKTDSEKSNGGVTKHQSQIKPPVANPTQGSIYSQSIESKAHNGSDVVAESSKVLSAWLPLSNASRPGKKLAGMASNLGWAHVFIRPPTDFGIKWKAICSPAMLPLSSDYIPSLELLRSYEENAYKVTIPDDELSIKAFLARYHLLNRMVSFRLAKGFQMLPRASSMAAHAKGHRNIHFGDECFKEDGVTVLMSKGDTVHSLCASGSDVQVIRYRPPEALRNIPSSGLSSLTFRYHPYIKTTFSKGYETRDLSIAALPNRLNWSVIDNFLAGHIDEFAESCGYWRARFVLIPVDPPSSTRRPLPALAEDSDDEVHIEGIQRLTQLWNRAQYNPGKNQDAHTNLQKHKDINPNPLGLEFQTRDVSAVLTAGLHDFLLHEDRSGAPSTQLFSNTEKYRLAKIDLRKLAADLQGDKGIKMQDRRWYFRLHRDSFVGLDLTSWLLYNFQAVSNREEATEVGQSLMEKGLFKHVSGRHKFRDGNFFYAIASEYRVNRSESRGGWFTRKNEKGSVPSTPRLGAVSDTPTTPNLKSGKFDLSTDTSNKPDPQPQTTSKRPTVRLSSVMQCDVGPRKNSDRPELINIHYDRLCNPDSCYHFRLEWMEMTAKLVEDSITSWASTAERYGLKLVELPVREASTIIESNPFRSPYIVELAIPPPASKPEYQHNIEAASPHPQSKTQHFLFHRALLRKFGFVLDVEAASNFPADVNISFSWGHQNLYKYSQYIHKTGVVLAQVTDQGKFLLLANRLAINRSSLTREAAKHDKRGNETRDDRTTTTTAPPFPPSGQQIAQSQQHHRSRPNTATTPSSNRSAFSPPPLSISRDAHPNTLDDAHARVPTAEGLRDEFEAFCSNPHALSAFYDELSGKDATMSARSTPMLAATRDGAASGSIPPLSGGGPSARGTPLLEAAIPKLELPVSSRFELASLSARPSPAIAEADEEDELELSLDGGEDVGDDQVLEP